MQLARPLDRSGALLARVGAAALALVILVVFALDGPSNPLGLAALALTAVCGLLLLPKPPLIVVLPALGALLLTQQISAGFHIFDVITVLIAAAALLKSATAGTPKMWELHGPGQLSLIYILIPFLAVPFTVISFFSFLGGFKELALPVVLFLSLRRLVPREKSHTLLWVFPVVGLFAAGQLLWRTHELGSRIYDRLEFRNFYTNLGWGWSDYIAALLEMCLLGTFLLTLLERRRAVRLGLFLAMLPMLQAFLILFSRAGTLALFVAGVILAVGQSGKKSAVGLGILALVVLVAMATPGGQVIADRFTDPKEFASYYTRIMVWIQSWNRFVAHPWTGIGLNQGRYQMDEMGDSRAHNPLLDALMDTGILGGLMFLTLVLVTYRMCMRAEPNGYTGRLRTVRAAMVAFITAVLLHAFVEPTISGYAMAFLLAWFIAWLTLQDPHGRSAPPEVSAA